MTIRSWIRKLFNRTPPPALGRRPETGVLPMFRSLAGLLFSSQTRTRRGPIRSRTPGRLLCLEALESRWLPSTTSIVVNSVLDNVNDAVITGPTVTLREAVNYANANASFQNPVDITFAPGVAGKTITLMQGQLELAGGIISIDGGTAGVTVSGNNASRVFEVNSGGVATLNALNITAGSDQGLSGGGGILNYGILVLTDCTLADDSAFNGGGIANVASEPIPPGEVGGGWLALTDCTFSGDSVSGLGEGIWNAGGVVTLTACTLSANTAPANAGGGIINQNGNNGSEGTLTLTDCIVANNAAGDLGNIGGGTISGSYDLIGDGVGSSALTNSLSGEPLLGPLGYYGGPTQTMPLLPGSLGSGAGTAASYFDPLADLMAGGTTISITTDQRGFTLPASNQDIGAFQTQLTTLDFLVRTTADPGVFGQQSLRGAVGLANVLGGSPAITFAPDVAGQTITWNQGQLELTAVSGTTTIIGGTAGVTVSGDNASRVFQVDSGATATFIGLTITAGQVGADSGGGILNQGTLTLAICTLSGSSAQAGGGILNQGTLTLAACTLSGDSAAHGSGGGIYNDGNGILTACTLTNDIAASGGGIFNKGGTLTLTDCTLAGSSAVLGGGIDNGGGALALTDSIVAQSLGADISSNGGSVSGSNDLIGDGSALGSLTNSLSGEPLLDPLGSYGGQTQTLPLLPGSLGIAAGTAADNPGTTTPITTDQRGQPLDSPAPDIGAFQTHGYSITAAGGSGQVALIGAAFANALQVTITANNNLDPIIGGMVTFAGPHSGASLAETVTAAIGNGGQASANVTANATGGAYTVSATALGISTPASFSLTNVGSGATQVGTTLYLVGGNSSDTVTIKHLGKSKTGSNGIQVQGELNGVKLGTLSYNTPPALLDIVTFNGNDKITLDSTLTIAALVSAGNGKDTIQLGQGNNNVAVGSGSDTITAGNGNNVIVANSGAGKPHITLGNGSNTVTVYDTSAGQANVHVGDGNNVITVGNGNGDRVQAGKGNNTIAVGNGSKISIQTTDGNNTITAGNGGSTIKVGKGNNAIVAGGGNNTIQAGNGSNLIVGGLGKDSMTAGKGNNILIDGSVNLSTGQLAAILFNEWIPSGTTVTTQAQIRTQLTGNITYNTTNANTLNAGGGFDWFWETYVRDHLNKKPNLLN